MLRTVKSHKINHIIRECGRLRRKYFIKSGSLEKNKMVFDDTEKYATRKRTHERSLYTEWIITLWILIDFENTIFCLNDQKPLDAPFRCAVSKTPRGFPVRANDDPPRMSDPSAIINMYIHSSDLSLLSHSGVSPPTRKKDILNGCIHARVYSFTVYSQACTSITPTCTLTHLCCICIDDSRLFSNHWLDIRSSLVPDDAHTYTNIISMYLCTLISCVFRHQHTSVSIWHSPPKWITRDTLATDVLSN